MVETLKSSEIGHVFPVPYVSTLTSLQCFEVQPYAVHQGGGSERGEARLTRLRTNARVKEQV